MVDSGVAIRFGAGTLRLTSDHLVLVQRGNHAQSFERAGDVVAGDLLLTGLDGAPTPVLEIVGTKLQGLHAPLTATGDLLANDVRVSCYVDVCLPYGIMHAGMTMWR